MPNLSELTRFEIGPAVHISVTVDMLELLAKVGKFCLERPALVPLEAAEQKAIEDFCNMVPVTVQWEKENLRTDGIPGKVLHGFCL